MTSSDPNPTTASQRATAEVWQQLSASLRASFERAIGPGPDVDDLLQECFLRIHKGLGDLAASEALGPWVRRIAAHLVTDRLRARGSPSIEVEEPALEPALQPALESIDPQVARWLPALINALSPKYADVLRRTELDGAKQREVAEELGLSLPAVKARVLRGRALVRERLLDCCALELDRRGAVIDYTKRNECRCSE